MNIGILIKEALSNLWANKMRSFLTMLGIFIGVGAVIAMMAIGQGAQLIITNEMSALGTTTLYVSAGNMMEKVRNPRPLTNADVAAISQLDCISISAPTVSSQFSVSHSNGNKTSATIYGVVSEYLTVANYDNAQGAFITQENLDNKDMVAVIGSEISESLFGSSNEKILGETIRITGQPYKVIGVLKSKGSNSFGINQDQIIFIPLTTAQTRLITQQRNSVSLLQVMVKNGVELSDAEKEIKTILRERHDIFEGNPNDFTVMNMQEMLNAMNTIMSAFVLFLGGIAGISLLVGGIGIMNIMLVTVTERTREIGLRKAIGAKNKDILAQFLGEAAVLSLVGGIFGIIFGITLAQLICYIATIMGTKLSAVINPVVIAIAVIFSAAVGLFFGIYPANRASKLDPVIALRSD